MSERKILITIDAGPKDCDGCELNTGYDMCTVWGNVTDDGRCPECLQAEKEAKA